MNLRRRIIHAVKDKNYKSKDTISLLGCSIDYFKNYIESLLSKDMSWNNYGSYWEIDHILPCASFDLKNSEEQEICFAYWNLQPLEKIENRQKGSKIYD